MYGVVRITPPSDAAVTAATPSVIRTALVSYSSPAAAALSVQSMPPTIVASANGTATGSLPRANRNTGPHQPASLPYSDSHAAGSQRCGGTPLAGAGTSGSPVRSPRSQPPQ